MDTEISPSHPESWNKCILEKTLSESTEQIPGCEIIKYNIQVDHIHMVMIIPPKYAVSDVVAQIKIRTSSELRKEFGWLHKRYWRENVVWSPGFFVSTIGVEKEKILKLHRVRRSPGFRSSEA
jgi:putative transposase